MKTGILAAALCLGIGTIGTIAGSGPAMARGALADIQSDYRSWGVPHASASISGTQQKTLVSKQTTGHYSVCNHGSHALTVNHDASNATVDQGDCMAVEAKSISVKGTHESAFNKAFIYSHTQFHHHHGAR